MLKQLQNDISDNVFTSDCLHMHFNFHINQLCIRQCAKKSLHDLDQDAFQNHVVSSFQYELLPKNHIFRFEFEDFQNQLCSRFTDGVDEDDDEDECFADENVEDGDAETDQDDFEKR